MFLLDYDQAEYIDQDIINYDSKKYIDWTLNRDFDKYKVSKKGWIRNFAFLNKTKHLSTLFNDSKFNLINTTYYQNQNTTNSKKWCIPYLK